MRKIKITSKKALLAAMLLSLVLTQYACAEVEFKTAVITCGDIELEVEIADKRPDRDKGLMYRETLKDNSGMLFVYPKQVLCKLWMKNTYIPLSAAFIDNDGMITQIVYMKKTNSAKIYSSNKKVRYALEVPLGWFKKNGIKVGDYCVIPDIPSK